MLKDVRDFAIKAHGDQKYGNQPYHVHLDAVAEIACEYGEKAQILAYMHDVVEDTDIKISTIEKEFGKFIAECVLILTDEPGNNRKQRKEKTYLKMKNVSGNLELALIVKAADRLANMRACIANNNVKLLAMYKEEHSVFSESVYRKGLCDKLWFELDNICRLSQHNGYSYQFWESDNYGLIRQKSNHKELHYPEIVSGEKWITGSPYVMDAITGMGEDPYSCGEMAFEITLEEAKKLCEELGVNIYG